MNREEIIDQIQNNLKKNRIKAEKILVQDDPYGGWNIAVISNEFKDMSAEDRTKKSLAGLEDLQTEWVELLTPEEKEWAGPLPGEIPIKELPLWPESLARKTISERSPVKVLSDLDEDIDSPIVTTFYSLRGGVGRSTALAYTARILAANKKNVVCVDMDLEAPALPILLGCESEVKENQGVVDLLIALDQGERPDFSKHLLPVKNAENLFVMPAGRVSADYARKLGFINPSNWYREDINPLRLFLDGLRNNLPFKPNVILLDARTGITNLSGPLLFDLADVAVIAFFPHPQAKLGTELLARSLFNTISGRIKSVDSLVAPEPRFLISAIPLSKSKEVNELYEKRPLEWITGWLEELNSRRQQNGLVPLEAEEITHFIRYREDIATSDLVGTDEDVWGAFKPIAQWIERFIPTKSETTIEETSKQLKPAVLSELMFSTGTAEQQKALIEDFVQTENIKEALSPDIPLIRGRKGTGKTAIFRFLSETQDIPSVIVHAPRQLIKDEKWILTADGFVVIDQIIKRTDLQWRHFWILYIAVAIEKYGLIDFRPKHLESYKFNDQDQIINAFEATANVNRGALSLTTWIRNLDGAVSKVILLLMDGLDTGFGSTSEDRDRRKRSIEGLFGAWMDLGQILKKLRFKILLREDIWSQLLFENKSHLFGLSKQLEWTKQTEYIKIVLKQAMRSASFGKHIMLPSFRDVNVDSWPEEIAHNAWNVLVGERMKGTGTTYTRNWIWNRLADANQNHSPRYLLQLFHEAVKWEREEERKNPYEKNIIRPRALLSSLSKVSEQALEALREEFNELESLLITLKHIGQTPISAVELHESEDIVTLAREVGVLAVYEESGDKPSRYKVPDLYRLGLGMTRKGQA